MKTELTPKVIYLKKRLVHSIITLLICASIFLSKNIYLSIFNLDQNSILYHIINLTHITISIIPLIICLKNNICILTKKYEIYEDTLINKESNYSSDHSSNLNWTTYHFYFKNYSKKQMHKYILGDHMDYAESKIGDKFYIISHGKLKIIFNKKYYYINASDKIKKFNQKNN